MELKIILGIIASLFTIAAYFPYLRDMFRGTTKPHSYTWLIWFLTTATATTALWYGGGGYGAISPTVSTLLTFAILVLSLKYGTRNINKNDTILLICALAAIVVWWSLQNPLLAVLMVTIIDAAGYWPSIRKSFAEPWSESVVTWVFFNLGISFSLLALEEYTLTTMTYLLMSFLGNVILIFICLLRRPHAPKPDVAKKS
jgi:hypothetical protein